MNLTYIRKLRGRLISITIACSRLRRSPDVFCIVEPALRAGSTIQNTLFARRSCASTRRERAKPLSIRHTLTALFAVVALLAVSAGVLSIEFVAHAKPDLGTPLRGGDVRLLKHAQLLGAVSGQRQLDLSVGLALNNQDELDSLLRDLYNPASPRFHQFLTPAEFAAAFGPTPDQQQQVVDYLRNLGFSVTSVSPNGLLINARTTVTQAEKGFKVNINSYRLGSRTFYANDRAPTIPSNLVSTIASIQGMDTASVMRPRNLSGSLNVAGRLGPHEQHSSPSGYGPSDLAGGYDANPLKNAGIQGSNQTIALVEFDGYNSSDITQYLSQ